MEFIEMTGSVLFELLNDQEQRPEELRALGVTEDSVVRINRQGDIELRRPDGWDVIGGLLGDFEPRVRMASGLDWA